MGIPYLLCQIDNLKSINQSKEIPWFSDLNSYKSAGYYHVGSHSHQCTNVPDEAKNIIFYLIVFEAYYSYQIMIPYRSHMYFRIFNADYNIWDPWRQL